jgi:general secretion pathway protein D
MTQVLRIARRAFAVCAIGVLAACAAQKVHDQGMEQIASGNRAEGIALLAQASSMEPTNSKFRIDYLTQQSVAVRDLLGRADAAYAAGDLQTARSLYNETLNMQPANERARRGLEALDADARYRAMVSDALRLAGIGDYATARAKLRQVLSASPQNGSAQRALTEVNDLAERAEEATQQRIAAASVLKKPVTLQFRDTSLRMVFEALSRTTGLNVIFDRDVRPDLKTTIFVRDATVGDSVNMILLQNQLAKKVLNANTLFIYPATSAKQREYQDLKVRTFQISNADAKYLQNMLKTVLKLRDISYDERSNTLVIRDTADAVAVAEKVIAAHDMPDAEVMLEVEVLEVARDRLSDIGILWPDNATISTPPSVETLGQLRDLSAGQLLITPLSARINLKLQDTDANLLASPRIRTRNKEKARIMIGDKVPVITNSVTPIQTGSAVVTGTVTYLDVGIKLEVEPQIYSEGDVGIRLNLEVSNIVKEVRNLQSGTLAYQIGTRSAQTNLRLRDGETQILGGLISDLDRRTASKVPGLGELPVLGRLFSSHATNAQKSEIILSITPRIVRTAAAADVAVRDVYSGTDAAMRAAPLRLDPVGSVSAATRGGTTPRPPAPAATSQPAPDAADPPAGAAPAESADDAKATPEAVAPTTEAPSAEPAPATPSAPAPAAPPPRAASTPPAAAAAPTRAAAAAQTTESAGQASAAAELELSGPSSVAIGTEFEVVLEATVFDQITVLPLSVRFDPQVLAFVGVQPDSLARGTVAPKGNVASGRLDFDVTLAANVVQAGRGRLLRLRFTAKAARPNTPIALAPVPLAGPSGPRPVLRAPTLVMRVES